MPALEKHLQNQDLGYLKIVASLWGVELTAREIIPAAIELSTALCDAELLEEIISTLPENAQLALGALSDTAGRQPWELFTRRFGELREIGPGKRDREKPYLRPISATETLWYRALLGRAFMETEKGPQEFAFIPDDLLEALEFIGFKSEAGAEQATNWETDLETDSDAPALTNQPQNEPEELTETDFEPEPIKPTPRKPASEALSDKPLGRPATPAEKSIPQTASDGLLEEITTLLAAIRTGRPIPSLGIHRAFILDLLTVSGFISRTNAESDSAAEGWSLNPETLKAFFESPRPEALSRLTEAWRASPELNELRQIPGLVCEGGWRNDALATRRFVLDLLTLLPKNQWWSLPALLRDLKASNPDFQRQGGEYDTWFIKRESDGLYLRGFAHWDDVEGALVRYIIQILHWLGLADVAFAQEAGPISAFRMREKAESREEDGKINVSSNGRISVSRQTPRSVRYQVARFCHWEESKPGNDDRYRVTPDSLKTAQAQGLKASQLLSLLAKNASGPLPPAFVKALQRWEISGTEARLDHPIVLRVSKPEVMSELKNSKAGRFIAEPLGPTAALIQPGSESKILEALSEMGLLADVSGLED